MLYAPNDSQVRHEELSELLQGNRASSVIIILLERLVVHETRNYVWLQAALFQDVTCGRCPHVSHGVSLDKIKNRDPSRKNNIKMLTNVKIKSVDF